MLIAASAPAMIAQAVLTTVSVDQGENSMLLLFKCDILDRSSPLWGSCWGLVSPFGSLRMSSQGNLFFFEKEGGRGGLGENCSLRSPFLVSTIWVLTHLAPKKLLFCAYPHSRFLKVLADQGSILESLFSVWMVDSKCFFFPSDTGPYVVLQATSLSLQDSLLHFSLSRFWGIPMDALSF